jgi:serine/threonine protein kinase
MRFDLYKPDALIGCQIAGYEITDFIDAGAAGLVFRGRRAAGAPGPGQPPQSSSSPQAPQPSRPDVAAIKLLAPPLGGTVEGRMDFAHRFHREADVLRRLTHPHILSVIASGEDADTDCFYLALPYMEGGSLASALVRRGPLPLADVAALLSKVADALDFAHAHGVIHRDVKPGNILLDAQGAPCLGDFGIVRLATDMGSQLTTTGRMLGSPAYMAPEQFSDTSQVGPLSDLYGLGMVAYQMVTGHVAFETSSLPALIHQSLSEAPASPRRARLELPEPAAAAVLKALEKDPARRFQTAATFAQAFTLGLRDQRVNGPGFYMTAPTPDTTIAAPSFEATTSAPAAELGISRTAVPPDRAIAPVWPVDETIVDQPDVSVNVPRWDTRLGARRWGAGGWLGARGALVVASLLLLVCLLGVMYLGASDSTQAPVSHAASNTPASATHPPRSITMQVSAAHGPGGDAPHHRAHHHLRHPSHGSHD